jgi:hypothetical protein
MILFSRSLKPDVESCPSVRSLATCSVSLSAKPASTQYYFKVLGLTAAKLWICFVNCFSHYGLERLDLREVVGDAKNPQKGGCWHLSNPLWDLWFQRRGMVMYEQEGSRQS